MTAGQRSTRANPDAPVATTIRRLRLLHADLEACCACPRMIGPVVHGPPIPSRVLLVGQAPGPREGALGRPFAWTAGRTLFRWFDQFVGIDEPLFRSRIYMTAVARCFPGKAPGGGDRRPDPEEIARCGTFLSREVAILRPTLVVPVGTLAIEQITGHRGPLAEIVGRPLRLPWHGADRDIICLPHPSGASTWHKLEPGATLLASALQQLARHPAIAALKSTARRAPCTTPR